MSSSLDVWFRDDDFLPLSSGRERKQPAKILFHNNSASLLTTVSSLYWPEKSVVSLLVPQQRHPTHAHLCATRWRAWAKGKGKDGRTEGRVREGKGSEKQVWLRGGEKTTLGALLSSLPERSFGHPNVLAIKFWENTLANAQRLRNRKNMVICFSLLWKFLSCLLLLLSSPSFPLSSPLHCFLQLKL